MDSESSSSAILGKTCPMLVFFSSKTRKIDLYALSGLRFTAERSEGIRMFSDNGWLQQETNNL
jgi:hypothetical protein